MNENKKIVLQISCRKNLCQRFYYRCTHVHIDTKSDEQQHATPSRSIGVHVWTLNRQMKPAYMKLKTHLYSRHTVISFTKGIFLK